jgi:hypothetical protein
LTLNKPFPVVSDDSRISFPRLVYGWMTSCGNYVLHDFQRAGKPLPDATELSEILRRLVVEQGAVRSSYDLQAAKGSRLGIVTDSWLDDSSVSAASWVLAHFNPNYFAMAAIWGAKHRPRRPMTTGGHLRPYAGLPAKEVAAKLGISLATVYRVRAASKKYDVENPQPTPAQREKVNKEFMQLLELDGKR